MNNVLGMTLLVLMATGQITTRQARTTGTPTTVPAPASNGSSDSFARVDHTHPLMSCANGQILKSNGSGWSCADSAVASYLAGANLVLTGNTFSLNPNPVVESLDITGSGGLVSSRAGPFVVTSSAPATSAVDVAHVVDTVTPYASFGSTDKIMSWRMGGQEVAYLNKFDFGFPTGHGYFASLMVGSWRVASPRSNAGSQNLAVYSAANAAGEFGVVAGTSESSTGQTSFAVCNDCDGAAPAYLFKVEGNGSASLTGTMTAPTFAGNLTGNASTATKLRADPIDCAWPTFAWQIDSSGNLTCAYVDFSIVNGQVEHYQIQDGPEGYVLTGSDGKVGHADWRPAPYQGSFYSYYTIVEHHSGGWPFKEEFPEVPWQGAFRPEKDGVWGSITCTGDGSNNGHFSGNLDVGVWDHTDQRIVCSCVLDGQVGSCGLDMENPATCDCENDGRRMAMEPGHVYSLIMPLDFFGCGDFPLRMDCNVSYYR